MLSRERDAEFHTTAFARLAYHRASATHFVHALDHVSNAVASAARLRGIKPFAVIRHDDVQPGILPLTMVLERLSSGPARAFGLPVPRLAVGEPADDSKAGAGLGSGSCRCSWLRACRWRSKRFACYTCLPLPAIGFWIPTCAGPSSAGACICSMR